MAGGDTAAGQTLKGRNDDLIGLVVFATQPESVCPLTLSHSALLHVLDAEEPRQVPGEMETNISDAVVLGLHRLHNGGSRGKILVLLSDGDDNVPDNKSRRSPKQAAVLAFDLGIPIYTIDAGGDSGSEREPQAAKDRLAENPSPRPLSPAARQRGSDDGKETLQKVAKESGGKYFQARDTQTLAEVCQAIDQLERTEIQSFRYRRYYEGFPWFGLAARFLSCSFPPWR